MLTKRDIEEFVDDMLEDESFEQLLERFNVTPVEAFEVLFDEGLIDETLLEKWMGHG